MKATPRVIVPYCPTLEQTLTGVGADVHADDLRRIDDSVFYVHADVSTVEHNGRTEGTLLYFRGMAPPDLFPHLFRNR